MKTRIIVDAALLISVAVLPWWVWAPCIFFAIIYFPFFWEGIIIAAVADTLYSSHTRSFFLSFPFAVGAFLLVVFMIPVRDRFRH